MKFNQRVFTKEIYEFDEWKNPEDKLKYVKNQKSLEKKRKSRNKKIGETG